MSVITGLQTLALSTLALLAIAGLASGEPHNSDSVHLLTIESIRQQKYDEADERIRSWMTSHPDDPNLRKAVHQLARYYSLSSRGEERTKAIRHFQFLVEKYPDADEAIAWWLGLGMTFERDRQPLKAVAALERGMSLLTERQPSDVQNLPDDAFEWLGGHYIDTKKWDKAIGVFDKWKPHPGCGTCRDSMEAIRRQGILFSLIQSQRYPEAVNRSWEIVATSDYYSRDTASLVLVRLYQEAGQLSDLRALVLELAGGSDELAAAVVALDRKDESRKLPLRRANAAGIYKALALIDDKRFETRMVPFLEPRSDYGSILDRLDSRVAAWLLIRDRRVIEPHIRTAMKNANYDKVALLKMLDLMANPRHFEGLTYRFFEPWPRPKPGSLPKTLPPITESTAAR